MQWTLRSRRYSPAMRRTLVKAVTRLGQHGDQAYSLEDILLSTGPQLFTEAVLQTAACELDEAVGWRNISGTVAPRKLGGTLVLPRIAFNADSGIDEEKERFVKHLFASSWKEKSWWPF